MLLSLSTGSLYIYPLKTIFRIAHRAGFDGVELVIGPEAEWRGPEYIRRLAAEWQLPVLTVHPPLYSYKGWEGINSSYGPYLTRALDFASAVQSSVLVVHTPRAFSSRGGLGRQFISEIENLKNGRASAHPILAIENASRFRASDSSYILGRLSDLRDFADKYDLAMTLDTAHIGSWDLDLLSVLDYFDGRLANLHFSDLATVPAWMMAVPSLHSYFRQHQLPGTGTLPLAQFLRQLAVRGFQGPITFELSPFALGFWSPRLVERRLKESITFVREALGFIPAARHADTIQAACI